MSQNKVIRMRFKFIGIVTVGIFLGGLVFSFVCAGSIMKSCHRQIPSSASENCLSHCYKKKLVAVGTEIYTLRDPGINTPVLSRIDSAVFLSGAIFSLSRAETSLSQPVFKLPIYQIYLPAIFSHAPPL